MTTSFDGVAESRAHSSSAGAAQKAEDAGPLTPLTTILLLIWFALVAGLGEAGGLAVRKLVNGNPIRTTPHAVWAAPLAEIFFFGVPLLVLLLFARFIPRLKLLQPVTFLLAALATLSTLLVPSWLSWHAALLLALGVGLQMSFLARRHSARFLRFVRVTTLPLVGLFVILGITITAVPWLRERGHISELPGAARGKPNVLLIIWDTVRARSSSLYGNSRQTTSHLEQLANEGVAFRRALAPSSWTLPSHSVMFTGSFPYELMPTGFWTSPLPSEPVTLAEQFSHEGYRTAAFVANTVFADRERGLDQGFSRYDDYPLNIEQILLSSALGRNILEGPNRFALTDFAEALMRRDNFARKSADAVNSQFLEWVEESDEDRPFFAFLNYFDAHAPYVPPEPFAGMYGVPFPELGYAEHLQRIAANSRPTAEERRAELAAYEEAITYVDDRLGLLLDSLEEHGILENTIVVVTSDHGEEFGEHGAWRHSTNLYNPQLQVPLVISYAGNLPRGRWVEEVVSLQDLPATILELAEVRDHSLAGRSLVATWSDRGSRKLSSPRRVYAETMASRSPESRICTLVMEPLQYISHPEREELYDLSRDPDQERNLSKSNEGALSRMRKEMSAIKGCPRSIK